MRVGILTEFASNKMLKEQKQTCLYLLCGLPCSGKTTFANQLAEEQAAVVFSLDRLVLTLYPEEDSFETHRKHVQRVEDALFPIVHSLLGQNCSMVMDFPAHTKSERDSLRRIATQAKVRSQLYYLRADVETITQRIQQRNAALKTDEYFIPDWLLDMIIKKFEPPASSENAIEVQLEW
jgi:predicted kinase